MIRAFGYCHEPFDPEQPGRLCRGRERWIEGTPDMPHARLARTVMSGAVFSDDSARDARRGFASSGLNAGRLLTALFPGYSVWAYAENGDPRALPARMRVEEDHPRHYRAGRRSRPAVRWLAQPGIDEVDTWMVGESDGLAAPRADAFVLLKGAPPDRLLTNLFILCGYGDDDDRPARKYNPSALPALLEDAAAVVLLHPDKHGPVLALYTAADQTPADLETLLSSIARVAGAFAIPFAIPPMLARWDRALYELRMRWDPTRDGDFPVPPAEDAGGRWSMRRRMFEENRHRRRGGDLSIDPEADLSADFGADTSGDEDFYPDDPDGEPEDGRDEDERDEDERDEDERDEDDRDEDGDEDERDEDDRGEDAPDPDLDAMGSPGDGGDR